MRGCPLTQKVVVRRLIEMKQYFIELYPSKASSKALFQIEVVPRSFALKQVFFRLLEGFFLFSIRKDGQLCI
ncbi:hypothetical protein AEQ18_03590 [Enterococcus sp. RIT-PI-f]|nr:hypothetical protein AEQ18_03590 [Enterococcus sp. RIT-PI-f]